MRDENLKTGKWTENHCKVCSLFTNSCIEEGERINWVMRNNLLCLCNFLCHDCNPLSSALAGSLLPACAGKERGEKIERDWRVTNYSWKWVTKCRSVFKNHTMSESDFMSVFGWCDHLSDGDVHTLIDKFKGEEKKVQENQVNCSITVSRYILQ